MRRRCAGFLLTATIAGAFAPRRSPGADQKWLRAATPNFELYTTDSERRAREAIVHFEQVRAFFASTASNPTLPSYPVRIVGFRSEKEFAPYRPHQGVAGYYQSGLHHDTIVMQGLDYVEYGVLSRSASILLKPVAFGILKDGKGDARAIRLRLFRFWNDRGWRQNAAMW